MSILQQLNSGPVYLICGGIILFVAIVCLLFIIRAWRVGVAIGMDKTVMKRVMISSATFSVLPAVGILLGVIALSGSLGTPWPWLRLSVIGALHYETQTAQTAAEQVGMHSLSAAEMTAQNFSTIALLMSAGIIWGMILSIFFNRRYLAKFSDSRKSQKSSSGGFGDAAMSAMFIGLVSVYLGSYIAGWVSGNGVLSFSGSAVPLLVAIISAAVMAVFTWLSEMKHLTWMDSFSVAGSMLIGMLAAVLLS